MRVGIVGDLHGNVTEATKVANHMGLRKITHVFVVGDVGLWTHMADGQEFLDRCNAVAEANGFTWFFVGGNHENWDHWEWFCNNLPTSKGCAMVRRRVLLAPKRHHFSLAGKVWAVAGGAVSIDADWRVQSERENKYGPRTLWWPNEQLTDPDVDWLLSEAPKRGKVDILLTHDCSSHTPFRDRLKPDLDSHIHRQRIDRVIQGLQPKVHFHGHMHTRYEWDNVYNNAEWPTRTFGLEADWQAMHSREHAQLQNWGILETDDLSFAFRGEGMQFRSLEPISQG